MRRLKSIAICTLQALQAKQQLSFATAWFSGGNFISTALMHTTPLREFGEMTACDAVSPGLLFAFAAELDQLDPTSEPVPWKSANSLALTLTEEASKVFAQYQHLNEHNTKSHGKPHVFSIWSDSAPPPFI